MKTLAVITHRDTFPFFWWADRADSAVQDRVWMLLDKGVHCIPSNSTSEQVQQTCATTGTELLLSEMPALSASMLKGDDAAALAGKTGCDQLAVTDGVRKPEPEPWLG